MGHALSGITVAGVSVARGGVPVVHGVDWDIAAGRWTGIIGANGSGKTTLLRAVAGRLPVLGGTVHIDGADLTDDRAARARAVGFAPDAASLPDALTGRALFAVLADGGGAFGDDRLAPLRTALDLDGVAGLRLGECSSGQRQRVAIYCAFVIRPGIVILDEPFNWLDPLAAYDARQALRALVDGGLTLVTALHDMTTLAGSCDAGLLLRDGRVAMTLDGGALRGGAADPLGFERTIVERLRARP